MPDSLPELLSRPLVAFTIQFDNELENVMPHRTAAGPSGSEPGPWLVSMAMWLNCLRYVEPNGVFVSDMVAAARTETNLNGMVRWGYVAVGGKPPFVTLKRGGRVAHTVCGALIREVEDRWNHLIALRAAPAEIAERLSPALPDCMPILHYGLVCRGPSEIYGSSICSTLPLPFLMARVLLAFALEYERRCDVSLAIGSNVLRFLGTEPVLVKELPSVSGISKEAHAMAIGYLSKRDLVTVSGSPKTVVLSSLGLEARIRHFEVVREVEDLWRVKFGSAAMDALVSSLSDLSSEFLLKCLEPYPAGWRARTNRSSVIPQFPMILHRGGYPDGA